MRLPPSGCRCAALALMLAGCAAPRPAAPPAPTPSADAYVWLNRLAWGANSSLVVQDGRLSYEAFLAQQLHPGPARLPPAVQAQIDAMTISQSPVVELAQAMEARRREAEATKDDETRKAGLQDYQREMTRLGREAAARQVLRDLYSSNQVQEQMTWFWLNHFSVYEYKSNIRAMLGDYDETVRAHALGQFQDLLAAVVHHPVMLRFLDNDQNAVGHINENYARESWNAHAGRRRRLYPARRAGTRPRAHRRRCRRRTGRPPGSARAPARLCRAGLFEFTPARHDFGPKELLGAPLHARGYAEIDEAIARLAHHPSTARFVSRRMAQYWLAGDPPPALVARMAETFRKSDGDIAQTLRTLFESPEFMRGAGAKFKDPMHYVISSVRLAYDDKAILNANPILNWLARMGEPLHGRQTPDGWPLDDKSWASPGRWRHASRSRRRSDPAPPASSAPKGRRRKSAGPSRNWRTRFITQRSAATWARRRARRSTRPLRRRNGTPSCCPRPR